MAVDCVGEWWPFVLVVEPESIPQLGSTGGWAQVRRRGVSDLCGRVLLMGLHGLGSVLSRGDGALWCPARSNTVIGGTAVCGFGGEWLLFVRVVLLLQYVACLGWIEDPLPVVRFGWLNQNLVSAQARGPAEFKHINKRRKRN